MAIIRTGVHLQSNDPFQGQSSMRRVKSCPEFTSSSKDQDKLEEELLNQISSKLRHLSLVEIKIHQKKLALLKKQSEIIIRRQGVFKLPLPDEALNDVALNSESDLKQWFGGAIGRSKKGPTSKTTLAESSSSSSSIVLRHASAIVKRKIIAQKFKGLSKKRKVVVLICVVSLGIASGWAAWSIIVYVWPLIIQFLEFYTEELIQDFVLGAAEILLTTKILQNFTTALKNGDLDFDEFKAQVHTVLLGAPTLRVIVRAFRKYVKTQVPETKLQKFTSIK